jgi:acyl-coenzyme A thioesterase PaaI-like protein
MSLLPLDTSVLTTEFKINLIAPATGDRIVARGEVVKAGRTLTIAQTRVVAVTGGTEKLVALLVATMMAIRDREDVSE